MSKAREIFIRVFDLIAGQPDEPEQVDIDFHPRYERLSELEQARWRFLKKYGREPRPIEIWEEEETHASTTR